MLGISMLVEGNQMGKRPITGKPVIPVQMKKYGNPTGLLAYFLRECPIFR